jgi:zinc and cadmium transporter
MDATFVVYLAAIAGVSFLGGLAPLPRNWSNRSLIVLVSFSGGILLGAAFFDMIPESAVLVRGLWLGGGLLAGFLAIFVLEHFLVVHPHPEHPGEHGAAHHIHLGVTAYAGLSFHSLLDGLALSSTYQRPALGTAVLLAIIAHTFPTAFALTSLLMLDHWSRRAIVLWMALFALSIPVGALLTWILLVHAGDAMIGAAIAVSAGSFLAISTSDILPQMKRPDQEKLAPLFAMFAGLAVSWLGVAIHG